MQDIAVIYRENDLFADLISIVENVLSELGYNVNVVDFDRSVSKADIKKKLFKARENFRGNHIITDNTCARDYDGSTGWDNSDISFASVRNIDSIFGPVLVENIAGVESRHGSKFKMEFDNQKRFSGGGFGEGEFLLEYYRDIFLRIVESVSKKYYPKKIFVAESRLTDHGPFGPFFEGSDSDAAEILKEWLSDAFDAKIQLLDAENGRDLMRQAKDVDRKDAWLIADRHNKSHEFKPENLEATVLELPLSNFLQTAMSAGLLEISGEDVEDEIRAQLRDKYGEG